jgi:RHS repeat-associated protein
MRTSRPPDRPPPSTRRRVLTLASLLALGAAGTLAGTALARDGFRAPDLPGAVVPDTVVLFGPRTFSAGKTGAYHVERFGASAAAGRVHTLRLSRGGASSVTVKLNGATLFAGAPAAPTLELPLTLAELNTLEVTVTGADGTGVGVSVLEVADATFTIWGSRRFYRYTGAPVTETERFTLSATAGAPYALHVENGAPDGTNRISSARVWVNGVEVLSPTHLNQNVPGLVIPVVLRAGENVVAAEVASIPEAYITLRLSATDVTAPVIEVTAPPVGLITRETSVAVAGLVRDETATRVTVNETDAARTGEAFSATVPLAVEGENTLTISATDAAGLRTDSVRTVIRDTEAPVVVLAAPADGAVTRDSIVTVSGTAADRTLATVNVNGIPVTPDAGGGFTAQVPVAEGANFLSVTAADKAGNATTVSRQVTRDTQAPLLTVTEPDDGATTDAEEIAVRGTVQDATPVTVSVGTSAAAVGADGSFQSTAPLAEGANELVVTATDAAGNTAKVTRNVTRQGNDVPPAPPVEPGVVTNLAESVQFLYTGENPVQTGVAPGAINPVRVSVLRGRVTDRDGKPLQGTVVTILDNPQYGQSTSRSDGWYDIVVNGGDRVIVNLAREGYLPAQRHVTAEWQEFASVPDVVLVGLDPRVTRVDLSADSLQVARGSVQTDEDGSRQATLIFEPGTGAEMVLPNGSVVPLGQLDVRATEYTVGANGPEAMPGPLPATSAYTYAVELSVDSALAAGATTVRFTQPVELYVENFLGFPVGIPVPVATYDCIKCGAWVPEDDGRTIRILSVAGGIAMVDADGDGAADSDAALNALGLDAAERAKLATLYADGASLWRVRMKHFSPIDLNYPNGPPDDAENPDDDAEEEQEDEDEDCEQAGSIIGCQNRTLGEAIGLTGTGQALHYTTARVPGRVANAIRIPLTDESVPASMKRVDLEVSVAGRTFRQSFPAAPNQTYTFRWDGMDAYGRRLQGQHPVVVKVGYVYPFTYRVPASTARSFGLTCTGPVDLPWGGSVDWQACTIPTSVTSGARQDDILWRSQRLMVGAGSDFDARALRLGGWTLSEHHAYDPAAKVLHMGNGSRRSADVMGPVITTVAGNGFYGSTGDGGQATQASIRTPDRVSVAADGTVYLPDASSYKVRRVGANGVITTVAGTGVYGFSGDGGPATAARISDIYDVALGPDGALYIADFSNHRIRRVGPDGIITTVAGNGVNGWAGDGGPATQAAIGYPWGLAVGPDCSIYIASDWNVIRKVSPDGTITTVAGNGTWGYSGDGGPATLAQINYPDGVALGPDGSLYIEDIYNYAIRRVTPDGIMSTFAGGGGFGNGFSALSADAAPRPSLEERADTRLKAQAAGEFDVTAEDPRPAPGADADAGAMAAAADVGAMVSEGDGGPATQVYLNVPYAVSVARDGTVYISESGASRVRQVAPDGIITTVTGSLYGFRGDGGPAAAAWLRGPWGVTVAPDGSLYISDTSNRRVRRIAAPLPGFSASDITVASEGGAELYQFSATGRHLRTLDAQTRVVHWTFDYDSAGRLVRMTDAEGRATVVERDGAGNPTAVVAPHGQRTALSLGADGYLATLGTPGGQTARMQYAPGGLLTSLTDFRGNPYTFAYNPDGSLLSDTDPEGNAKVLTRTRADETADGFGIMAEPAGATSTFTTAGGRTTTFQSQTLVDGTTVRTVTDAAGLVSTSTTAPDGTTTLRTPEGMERAFILTGDPRWGMQAPIVSVFQTRTPGGRTMTLQGSRSVRFANPADPTSVLSVTDSSRVNGMLSVSSYDAVQRRSRFTTAEGRTNVTRWDAEGRAVVDSTVGLLPLQYGYDAEGRVNRVTQGTRVWRFEYGTDGRMSAVVDPMLRRAEYAYDPDGKLVTQRMPGGAEVHYGYDGNGNVTSIAPAGRPAHRFGYSLTDRVESHLGAGDSASITRYAHDPDGQITSLSRSDGRSLAFRYDAAGRLAEAEGTEGLFSYGYDESTGQLSTMKGGAASLAFTYDGSLATSLTLSGAVSGTVSFGYDSQLRLSSQVINGGHAVAYQYDRDGLLTAAGALQAVRDASTGFLKGTTLGVLGTTYQYDGYGSLQSARAVAGAATVLETGYVRDDLGRITEITETDGAQTTRWGYGYDAAGRLAQVTRDGAAYASYEYDANGNRLRAVDAAGVVDGSYDNHDRLVSYGGVQYGYTPDGEMAFRATGADTTAFTYDVLGNLASVRLPSGTQVEYLLDPAGRRVGRKVDGVTVQRFLYGGPLNPVAEVDSAGTVLSRFVYGTAGNAPDYMVRGGRTYRLVADHLGSVRRVVDVSTGEVVQRLDYDAFGRTLTDSNPGFQPFGYAGGMLDTQTGLVRFGARDYDPSTGRWTRPDPLGFEAGDPNLYAYVMGDPVNMVDPSGLSGCECEGTNMAGAAANAVGGATGGGGGALEYALRNHSKVSKKGQVMLGGDTGSGWKRNFHIDGPHGKYNYPHLNADAGTPLRPWDHNRVPQWMHDMGNPRNMRRLARGAGALGAGLSAYDVLTAGPCDFGRAVGGAAGGMGGAWAGAAIGTAIAPGVGTVIGGIIGGFLGSAGGQAAGSQFDP